MATRTFEQDANSFGHILSEGFALTGARIGAALQAMGPKGRRFALTGLGAIVALGLGAATASAFRLPSEVTDPAQTQDQTLAQSELPSETAARNYALENPPLYPVKADQSDDAVASAPTLAIATPADDSTAIQAAYTGRSTDADASDDDHPVAPASATAASDNVNR